MIDKEKVMQWLKICANGCEDGCPYEYKNLVYRVECKADLMSDALEMLEEKEPIVIHKNIVDEIYDYIACCPECDMTWAMWYPEKMRFCPGCGKAVKWE